MCIRDRSSSSASIPEEEGANKLYQPSPSSAAKSAILSDAAEKNAAKAAPTFSEPVFDAPASSAVKARAEDVLSPGEREEEDVAP